MNSVQLCSRCGHTFPLDSEFQFNDDGLDTLRSNDVPGGRASYAGIHTSIDLAAAALYNHQVEIIKLQSSLSKLQAGASKIRQFIDAKKSLLSPIRRLPPELLALIFEECCEYNEIIKTPMQAGTLSSVCSAWRYIAINLSSIWSWISICFRPVGKHEEKNESPGTSLPSSASQRLDLCLERSQAQLLQIRVSSGSPLLSLSDDERALWSSLIRSSGRWKVLVSNPHYVRYLESSLHHLDLPNLRKFVLLDGIVDSDEATWLGHLWPQHQALCNLDLGDVYPSEIDLPWHGIETLRHDRLAFTELHGWIGKLSRLCTWRIIEFINDRDTEEAMDPQDFPRLETLEVGLEGDDDGSSLFELIHAAQLLSVDISCEDPSAAWNQTAFTSMLFRSSCLLQEFCVHDVRIPDDKLLECLSLMPFLNTLVITEAKTISYSGPITDKFMKGMTLSSGCSSCCSHEAEEQGSSADLVPKLASITFRSFFDCDHVLLIKMIESRFRLHDSRRLCSGVWTSGQLTTAELLFWCDDSEEDFGPEVLDRLNDLSRMGLRVERYAFVDVQ